MVRETIETNDSIRGFFGKYRPLSNFDTTPFIMSVDLEEITFPSAEHAFHYLKTEDEEWKSKILNAPNPSIAKKLGRKCLMRNNWDDIKVGLMNIILFYKFAHNANLKELLLSTGDKYLEETNDWNDKFWGVCNGVGKNNLGKCLMKLREKLKENK